MANVISGADYKYIAQQYGSIATYLSGVSSYLLNAVTRVAINNDIDPTVDLIQDFYNSYTTNSVSMVSTTPLLPAVRKLNSHVMNRGTTYTSIGGTATATDATSFLAVTGQTVPQSWANLSSDAGTPINSAYIVG